MREKLVAAILKIEAQVKARGCNRPQAFQNAAAKKHQPDCIKMCRVRLKTVVPLRVTRWTF
jgi:hypothetical protein